MQIISRGSPFSTKLSLTVMPWPHRTSAARARTGNPGVLRLFFLLQPGEKKCFSNEQNTEIKMRKLKCWIQKWKTILWEKSCWIFFKLRDESMTWPSPPPEPGADPDEGSPKCFMAAGQWHVRWYHLVIKHGKTVAFVDDFPLLGFLDL